MKKYLLHFKKLFLLSCFFVTGYSSFSQLTLAEWNFPNTPDDAIADIAIPANAAQTIYTVGGTAAVGYGTNTGATTRSAWCTGWNSGMNLKWWEIQVNTTGYYNLEISSKQRSSSTGPKNFALQYKIGAAGAWTPVPAAPAITVADNFTAGVLSNIVLPAACENQTSVYFRWIMTTNTPVSSGVSVASGGSSRIDDVNISANNSSDHYRSIASGNWNNPAIWEVSPTATWPGSPTTIPPSKYSLTITIRSPDSVVINTNASMDELTIQNGGILAYVSGTQTINDGAGVDMQVDGMFIDASNNATIWSGAAPRWALGANGTYVKAAATNATNWQNNYNGGISTIPATANWDVIKYAPAINPTLTTVNMFYPNLTIANVSGGTWLTTIGSTFTGNLGFATVKGNLDIGGNLGFGFVDFTSDNSNVQPTIVMGNLIVRNNCALRNNGTGFEVQGNVAIDGTVSYTGAFARKFVFTQGASQTISGAGTFGIYDMQVNKTANDITLNRTITIDHNLNLLNGKINSTLTNLVIIIDDATVTNTSNASFVRGPVRKLGDDAFTFPVGKNNDYQTIVINAAPTAAIFWTENFNNGCNSLCLASAYSGANGAWTMTNNGPATDCGYSMYPNKWYVSCAENGNAVGFCGTGCSANATLHVGKPPNPYWDVFSCIPGDCGAEYIPGGICGNGFSPDPINGYFSTKTDQRMESPVINCTGLTNINLSFNYIEGGAAGHSFAALMYYDGASWSQLTLMPQTTPCSSNQKSIWANYNISLPASANNNPSVKIGFRWYNDDFWSSPAPYSTYVSFAVDDINLKTLESFTAEYFNSNPQIPYGNILDPTLNHISQCEYWILNRDIGTSSRTVTLTWDANSCGVTNLADLRVARWQNAGTIWNDLGNGGTTGTIAAGTIVTAAPVSIYGPFTLASTSTENPLPIQLLNFAAAYNGKTVDLNWTTASENNSDYFTIERSGDKQLFSEIIKVKSAGNNTVSNYYYATDNDPLKGISYYRLRQTDFNGISSLSRLVTVKINDSDFGLNYLYPDQSLNEIYFQLKNISGSMLKAEVIDVLGRIIISQNSDVADENEIYKINSSLLKSGLYTLRISNNESVINKKFFY